MLMTTVPLFDKDMMVGCYMFCYQKLARLTPLAQTSNMLDGASRSAPLEILELIGLDAFTLGKPVFVPISHIMLLGDLTAQHSQPPERLIFLLEEPPVLDETFLERIRALREQGYRFGVKELPELAGYEDLLSLCDYIFLSGQDELRAELAKQYPALQAVATGIETPKRLDELRTEGYALYESSFYRVPVAPGDTSVSPLKMNSIRLINIVQDENFDFDQITDIVQGDPALTISLLRMVNGQTFGARGKITTISHAVAMLGQREVRKWVVTAVAQKLGDDRPNEITRISLLRAKFAENLARLYDLAHMGQELFLMGLFSLLDVMLQVAMADALKMVMVSSMIEKALIENGGIFAPILELLTAYEAADWPTVSREMIVHDISEKDLLAAYTDALVWYKNMVKADEPPEAEDEESEAAPAEA